MNCEQCQRYLLSCERFDSHTPEAAGHLAECVACRQWQKRLVQIESHVAALPLPRSDARAAFVQDFLQGKPLLPMAPSRSWSRRQTFTLAAGVAAAILLVAGSIALIQSLKPDRAPVAGLGPKGPRINDHTLGGKLLELDLRLAESESPRRRVETLAQVAENLHGESRALAKIAGPKDLDALARLYDMVVREGIVARARHIPAEQRQAALDPIAEQLAQARRSAEDMAANARPDAAAPLLLIAAAARTGDRELRDLIKEATP